MFILTKGITIQPTTVWEIEFNDLRQIQSWTLHVDTYQIAAALNTSLSLNRTQLCESIQNNCQGVYQQYNSTQECINFMDTIPLSNGPTVLGSGNSVQCRTFHNILAGPQPQIHCLHVSSKVLGLFVTPCTDPSQYY